MANNVNHIGSGIPDECKQVINIVKDIVKGIGKVTVGNCCLEDEFLRGVLQFDGEFIGYKFEVCLVLVDFLLK